MEGNRKKKEIDRQALGSSWTRISGIDVAAARDLLDLGFQHLHQLTGRSPEALYDEIRRRKPETPRLRLLQLRMAVYLSETDSPEPRKTHPHWWND